MDVRVHRKNKVNVVFWQLGQGDYSTKTTKVLRMVSTLGVDDETKHTIEALRSELQKTKAKLQAVEELKGQSGEYLTFENVENNNSTNGLF